MNLPGIFFRISNGDPHRQLLVGGALFETPEERLVEGHVGKLGVRFDCRVVLQSYFPLAGVLFERAEAAAVAEVLGDGARQGQCSLAVFGGGLLNEKLF